MGRVKNRQIYRADCRDILPTLFDVNLVVTSPPYNAGQEYEDELSTRAYVRFITEVFQLLRETLAEDGRICWIVAPTISKKGMEFPFPLAYLTIKSALKAKLKFWEEIIWNQQYSEAQTAWGSYQSAKAPFIRHQTERILLFTKKSRRRIERGESNNFKEKEFEHSTLDIWNIGTVRSLFHPCPFPLPLVRRCVKLFSYIDDTVLDPFMGTGGVGVVCKELNRFFIGIEKHPRYFKYAKRILIDLKDYLDK